MLCIHKPLRDRAWLPMLGGAVMMAHDEFVLGLIFALPPAIVWVGSRSWPVLRSAGRFGDLSYGIYLWAWPVQQILVMLFGKSLSVWQHMAVALPVTVACALASWHLVEKRALRLKPERIAPPDDLRAPVATAPS
jgi:peptidoglycan/LPS O-acetylase OafA/YrhL